MLTHPFLAVVKPAPPFLGLNPWKPAGARGRCSALWGLQRAGKLSTSADRRQAPLGSARLEAEGAAVQSRSGGPRALLGGGAASGEGGVARGPASPRPRPRATARAWGALGPGRAGPTRVRAKATHLCRHAGAAPAAQGAAAAGPGGTWPPASRAGPSGPWGCLARPRGHRLSPSGSCWPPRGAGWLWPPLRPPRRHPRREAARPDGRDCGSRASAAGFPAAAGRSLRAAARSAGPARPARGWPPGGSQPGRRTAPPVAVGRRPHGLASPRRQRCRHPHEPSQGGPARGCPHCRPHRRSSRA